MLQIKHASTGAVLFEIEADTWEGRSLAGKNLDEANLARLQLSHSSLRQASLRRADLTSAMLHGVCLDGANLEQAVLAGSDLTSATLLAARLPCADLRQAVLRYANMAGASLEAANLQGADLSMADARANFRHASLVGCDLRGANLAGANLHEADLSGADLTGANLAGAVLIAAKLHGTKMPPLRDARLPVARIAAAEGRSAPPAGPATARPPGPAPESQVSSGELLVPSAGASAPRQPGTAPESELSPGQLLLPTSQGGHSPGSPRLDGPSCSGQPQSGQPQSGQPQSVQSQSRSRSGQSRSNRSRSGQSTPGNPKQPGADWMRTSGPDFSSVLVSCPECGLSTRLGAEYLDANYRCRGCQTVFKLDQTGRPKAHRTKRSKATPRPWRQRRESDRGNARATQALLGLLAVVTLCAMVVGGWRVAQWFMLPTSLADRSLAAAEAYVRGDAGRLTMLARMDSAALIEQWLARRPERWNTLPAHPPPQFRVQNILQQPMSASATVEATLPASSGTAENAEHALLEQLWVREDSGQWLLDVAGTLAVNPLRH